MLNVMLCSHGLLMKLLKWNVSRGMGSMQNIPTVPTMPVLTPMPLPSVSPMPGMTPMMSTGLAMPLMATISAPALANGPVGVMQPTPVSFTNGRSYFKP